MRLISQYGVIDIPYEYSALYMEEHTYIKKSNDILDDKHKYYCICAKFMNRTYDMGEYDTEEEAKEVLKAISEASICKNVFHFPVIIKNK